MDSKYPSTGTWGKLVPGRKSAVPAGPTPTPLASPARTGGRRRYLDLRPPDIVLAERVGFGSLGFMLGALFTAWYLGV